MNYLTIGNQGKAIPYGPVTRADGGRNYGFRNLKGNPATIETVPEALNDPAMHALLMAINSPSTGLFSVGCVSAPIETSEGNRYTGYFEFALNDMDAIGGTEQYFPIFFHFDQLWKKTSGDLRAHLNWELVPALFVDVGVDGFTCVVTVNTHFYPSLAAATDCWQRCLALLSQHLSAVPALRGSRPILVINST